jgi:hypothetical protein
LVAVVVSVVKTDEPPGVDAVQLFVDEALDIPFEALGLLPLFYLYLGHLSFSFSSHAEALAHPSASSISLQLACSQLLPLNPPSEHCKHCLFIQVAGFTGCNQSQAMPSARFAAQAHKSDTSRKLIFIGISTVH